MQKWQSIWERERSGHLWWIPDQQLAALSKAWRREGTTQRVLDVGCGMGRHAHLLASEGFEVYGSDHSVSAIENCKAWFAEDSLQGAFWCSELDDVPYPDGYFDAIVAFNSIYHGDAAFLARVVELLHRKLRPGGHCFVTLPSRDNRMYGKGERVGEHTFLSPGMFDRLFDHGGERGVPHHFSSEQEVRTLFRGFQIATLHQEELCLASPKADGQVKWLRVSQAFFWRLVAGRN